VAVLVAVGLFLGLFKLHYETLAGVYMWLH
jgi:hypothetical protein